MTFGLENLLAFGKFSDFHCITPETERGGKRAQFPGHRITAGAQKIPTMSWALFFKTVHLLPKDLGFEHGAANLFLAPGAI